MDLEKEGPESESSPAKQALAEKVRQSIERANEEANQEHQSTENHETDLSAKFEKDEVQKFLNQVPPDFDEAEVHGVKPTIFVTAILAITSRAQPKELEMGPQ